MRIQAPARKLLLRSVALCLFLNPACVNLYAQTWGWAKGGINGHSAAYNSCVDASGNSYVTGSFGQGTISFDNLILTGSTARNVFLVKYDPSGNALWAKTAAGSGIGYSVNTDAAGNIYLAGSIEGKAIAFDTCSLSGSDMGGPFLVKYDSGGNVQWAKGTVISGQVPAYFGYYVSACDAAGNSWLAGNYPAPQIVLGTYSLTGNPGSNESAFVAKYDAAGNVLWAENSANAGGNFTSLGIAADAGGNVYVTGSFMSPQVTFGTFTLTNNGFSNQYVAKYGPNGNVLWANSSTGSSGTINQGYKITTDAAGNVFVVGAFNSNTITLGNISLAKTGTGNTYLAKYDPLGNVIWAKSVDGPGNVFGHSVCTDAGNVYLTGIFASSVSSGSLSAGAAPGVSLPLFIASYDLNGNINHLSSLPGPHGISTVRSDNSCNVFISGTYTGNNFSVGTTTFTNSANGSPFIAKLSFTCSSVGLQGIEGNGAELLAFPNPFSSEVTMQSSVPFAGARLSVVNALGQTVKQVQNLSGSEVILHREDLAAGIYIVYVEQKGRVLSIQKLMVAD